MSELEKSHSEKIAKSVITLAGMGRAEAVKLKAAVELSCAGCGKPLLLYIPSPQLVDYYVLGHLDDTKCGFIYHGTSLDDVMKLWIQDRIGVELD